MSSISYDKKEILKKADSRLREIDEEWTNTRIKGIGARNELTNEWKNRGATTKDYAILTDEISKATFNITTQQHKDLKGLQKQNLRDNMSAMELALMTLAEVTMTELHKNNNSQGVTLNLKKMLELVAISQGKHVKILKSNWENQL